MSFEHEETLKLYFSEGKKICRKNNILGWGIETKQFELFQNYYERKKAKYDAFEQNGFSGAPETRQPILGFLIIFTYRA